MKLNNKSILTSDVALYMYENAFLLGLLDVFISKLACYPKK